MQYVYDFGYRFWQWNAQIRQNKIHSQRMIDDTIALLIQYELLHNNDKSIHENKMNSLMIYNENDTTRWPAPKTNRFRFINGLHKAERD